MKHSSGTLSALFLGLLYLRTLAPGLTWAFDGADGGDLIAAAATGGVPHPTGYPTYVLVASAFLHIPIGSLAYRTNLLSLVATVLACSLLYGLVFTETRNTFGASVAAIAFGTSPLTWSQAIITEVYALQAILTILLVKLLIARRRSRWTELALGIVAGLTVGNHMMGALLLPLLFIRPEIAASTAPGESAPAAATTTRFAAFFWRRLLGLIGGLMVYAVIPLRAGSGAPVNWAHAVDAQSLLSLITGQMYWSRLGHLNGAYLLAGVQSWSRLLTEQWTVAGLLLSLFGLLMTFRIAPLHVATAWMAITASILSIVYYSPDSYVYLVPAVAALSVWIGLGSKWLLDRLGSRQGWIRAVAIAGILGLLAGRAVFEVPRMDLSNDVAAEEFSRAVLEAAPEKSILLTRGDEATFALWYYVYALHQRADLAVVSGDLYSQGWYRKVLAYTYPELMLPLESLTASFALVNPGRATCTVDSVIPAHIDCGEPAR